MIFDTLANARRYAGLHPGFDASFDYLRRFDHATPDGRHDIDGDRIYALVQSYETRPAEAPDKFFETHRRYIDIQYLVAGEEAIPCVPAARLTTQQTYDAQRDLLLYTDCMHETPALSEFCPGDFAIYFPEDAHKPGCTLRPGHSANVRKIVIKIAV
ncbi:YhcH/YjgK/YiaL family protein [Opitutaceae bacterium TAV4]|nr:YhcH/YjgK/YiaL family protein [Opitutaceae bacterium TAV4]RRJ99327.1 YhcH/YjgK/YiaL family protein [Opitutaceae bacterium TAV3]